MAIRHDPTHPRPSLWGVDHTGNLDDLDDVTISGVAVGDVPQWSGAAWVNTPGSSIAAAGALPLIVQLIYEHNQKANAHPNLSGGASDHGALTGLSDDDHPQYLLADGSRDLTGTLTTDVDSTNDLGEDAVRWANVYADAHVGALEVDGGGIGGIINSDASSGLAFEVGGALAHDDAWYINSSGILYPSGLKTSDLGIQTTNELTNAWLQNLSVSIAVKSDLIPDTDSTYDIGADATRWANGYFDSLFSTDLTITGTSTGIIGADVDITDTGGYYTGTEVETALQEIGVALAATKVFLYERFY